MGNQAHHDYQPQAAALDGRADSNPRPGSKRRSAPDEDVPVRPIPLEACGSVKATVAARLSSGRQVVACSQLSRVPAAKRPANVIEAGRLARRMLAASWACAAARHACVTGWAEAPSLLQSRAQPQGLADGTAHPAFGLLGPP